MTFESLAIHHTLIAPLNSMRITEPTPIQMQAIPMAMQGRDVLASSPTGSGKTLAYVLPIVTKLLTNPHGTALILTPTRELATQVRDSINRLLPTNALHLAMLIGGEAITGQLMQLKRRPRIVIGTPGRVTDHLMRKTLNLSTTAFLVLDETDRMLEMGFSKSLEFIFNHLPTKEYQTFMFSATLPSFIMQLAEKHLSNPAHISLAARVEHEPQITQESVFLSNSAEKFDRLLHELTNREGTIIIFVKTKFGADELTAKLREYAHKVEALHGDLRQHKRDRAVRAFRLQKYRIMVATDIASRGLDIPHVQHVINYDVPQCAEDYLHRIGRTGRAGAKGQAISLISRDDMRRWKMISRSDDDSGKRKYEPNPGNSGTRKPYRADNKRGLSAPRSKVYSRGQGYGSNSGQDHNSSRRQGYGSNSSQDHNSSRGQGYSSRAQGQSSSREQGYSSRGQGYNNRGQSSSGEQDYNSNRSRKFRPL